MEGYSGFAASSLSRCRLPRLGQARTARHRLSLASGEVVLVSPPIRGGLWRTWPERGAPSGRGLRARTPPEAGSGEPGLLLG
ncbi:MAG: hypothetical protein AAFQ43_10655, partial [Bacteroidota bacterium]